MHETEADHLTTLRARLDALDDEIIALIVKRLELIAEVGAHKKTHDIPMMQPHRVDLVLDHYRSIGLEFPRSRVFSEKLGQVMVEEGCRLEDEIIAE